MNPSSATAETLRVYSDLLVAIRRSLVGPDETTAETLLALPDGLSTGPLPFPGSDDEALALWLDLRLHKLVIATSYGSRFELTLKGHSAQSFADAVLDALALLGVITNVDLRPYSARVPLVYDADDALHFLQILDLEKE